MIEGLSVTPLKQINHPKGNIFHALKSSDVSFCQFGEAYFSTVLYNDIKGWKKHLIMQLNLIVPVGEIKFVIYDERENSKTKNKFFEISLSQNNYCRLTIPAGVWLAFQGRKPGLNMLLNIASIEHDPLEAETKPLQHIIYDWK